MSTNNNASQTLFRFVSLRNPQLTETKERNLGFIHRPKGAKGVFDTAVTGMSSRSSKLGEMVKAARTFSNAGFETEKKIEEGVFGELLNIGRKLSKKEVLDNGELIFVKDYYSHLIDTNKELTTEGLKIFVQLWDNYIYQIVTQGDFYVKEAISHVLMAIHVGFAQSLDLSDQEIVKVNGEKPLEKAFDGKIVLPKYLFSEDSGTTGSVSSKMSVEVTEPILTAKTTQRLESEVQAALTANKALHKKEALEKLNTELEKLQRKYYKSREQAYQESYARYLDENREALELYEKKLAEVDSKITEETPEEEKIRLYEELRQYEVKPFEFSYQNEINVGELMENLSPESFALFVSLFAEFDEARAFEDVNKEGIRILSDNTLRVGSQTIVLDDEIQTYSDALNIVGDSISTSMETALENSPLTQQQYVNLGGASVPVVNTTARTPMAYSFFAHSVLGLSGSGGFVNFSFEVEDVSWSVANARITATTDTAGSFEENYSNIPMIDNKITLPVNLINKFRASVAFKIEIIFDNGSVAYADLGQQYIKQDISLTGMLTLKRAVIENPQEPETVIIQKRKNFGIKRLGVADYLKVVQSVHAYVPGEVSNIENVMASELRHKSSVARDYSEITDTTSKSQETEKISDTTKTSRTDMQTEVAKELDKQQGITAYTRYSYGTDAMKFEIGADYANNTAQHDSTRQAMMKSQEITERAMERVLTKISEERVQKIIKEYTETNVHEYDNRGKVINTDNPDAAQPKHITGVYRWIDMKYKNQIYNYGKRTMFEFMVPEPSRLHRLALTVAKAQVLTAPVDPRTAPERAWTMPNPKSATVEQIQHWAQIYGVSLDAFPAATKQVIHNAASVPQTNDDFGVDYSQITIPDNYAAKNASFSCRSSRNRGGGWQGSRYSEIVCSNLKGDMNGLSTRGDVNFDYGVSGLNLTGNISFQIKGHNVRNYNIKVTVNCELSDEFINKWKTESFNAIIKAYEEAYQKFLEEQARLDAEQKEKEEAAKERQGNYYRYMEHDTLKHNCIAYLLQDYITTLGQVMTNGAEDTTRMDNFQVYLNDNLDQYAALAKFMEQAFEWEIMDYTFYPYYWANRKSWQEFYLTESVDPLFRSFLQAGMARIIVTVKPGFEAAVQFFLETGLIWNGGAVPVIGDPMYMSIVDEMRQPTGEPQGKYWITRVPTTLTILQDKSTGLPVDKPLPIFPEDDPKNCENPKELEFETSFEQRDIQLTHGDKETSTLD
ncbi:hypothetical protein SAMN05880574_11956 [Chryseobacterium sp. RU37D]|uniref:hypothetical protein n=1 Tax=Chryseobacterium sp. RU37D TaxID=1907397 RepID=UPI000955AD33|nr:hypothetical protein [Chryseobacterium sp. RU37D]SIQ65274.1 hypothetical protein SAMN05880574_11956 [Chryseobacterium sp. RU37D]